MTTTHTIELPGVRLCYDVRGSGPLLILVGSPMAAEDFAGFAEALATDHTVVTHDPRGVSRSVLDDPDEPAGARRRADDVVAIMDAMDADSAHVFGSSGGAVTGLALAQHHPERLGVLIAHEPPLMELLPDAERHRADNAALADTYRRHGMGAAWAMFMSNAGFDAGEDDDAEAPPAEEPSPELVSNSRRFFLHDLRATSEFLPDFTALEAMAGRLIVGLGAESGPLETAATSRALAERTAAPIVEFPGGHTGFMSDPQDCAKVVRRILAG